MDGVGRARRHTDREPGRRAAQLLAVYVVVGLFFAAGLAGSMLPLLPGPPLIVGGALVYAVATDWTPIGAGRLLILAGLAALAYLLTHVAGALGAKRFGGSWWGVAGALVGAVVGVFFAPLGLILGPVAGAMAGEMVRGEDLGISVRSGLGALVGLALGIVANLGLAVVMIGLFLWWVARA